MIKTKLSRILLILLACIITFNACCTGFIYAQEPTPIPTAEPTPTPAITSPPGDFDTDISKYIDRRETGRRGEKCLPRGFEWPKYVDVNAILPSDLPGLVQAGLWYLFYPVNGIINTVLMPVLTVVQLDLNHITQQSKRCIEGIPSTDDPDDDGCICIVDETARITRLCMGLIDKRLEIGYKEGILVDQEKRTYATQLEEREACMKCSENDYGFWTGLGCIPYKLEPFIQNTLFGLGIGLAGATALMCIIYAAFILQISGSDPQKMEETRELITSCTTGLLLIIFSVFILRVIGVDILRIPGFGEGDVCRKNGTIIKACPSDQYCPSQESEAVCEPRKGKGQKCSTPGADECKTGLSCRELLLNRAIHPEGGTVIECAE